MCLRAKNAFCKACITNFWVDFKELKSGCRSLIGET